MVKRLKDVGMAAKDGPHAMPCQHAPCSIRDKPCQWNRKRISRQLFGESEVHSGTDWRLDCQGASHQGGTDCLTLPGCCLTVDIGTSHVPGVSCLDAQRAYARVPGQD